MPSTLAPPPTDPANVMDDRDEPFDDDDDDDDEPSVDEPDEPQTDDVGHGNGDDAIDEEDGDDDDGPWLTIATYWQPMEAHIARLKLESEEIDCFLLDEFLIATDWLLANAVGGIKLQVRASDAEAATKILAMHRQSDAAPEVSEEPVADGQEKCPNCGSGDIAMRWGFNKAIALVGLLIAALPLAIPTKRWTCRDCGFRW